ncbi:MAG: hypothetical protein OHK0057_27480 [Thermoflexibacter sp.]
MSKQKKITFTVNIDQANKIFRGLGKLPFEEVYELIGMLNEQANQQLTAQHTKTSSKEVLKNMGQGTKEFGED